MYLSFIHPYSIQKPYETISSVEHKDDILRNVLVGNTMEVGHQHSLKYLFVCFKSNKSLWISQESTFFGQTIALMKEIYT